MPNPAAAVVDEMSWSIQQLSSDQSSAKAAYSRIARVTGLPVKTIERLRYRKMKSVPAHCADAIRAALLAHVERQEEKFRNEAEKLRSIRAARAALARPADLDCDALSGDGGQGRTPVDGLGAGRLPDRTLDAA